MKAMRVAVVGTRGIPGVHGGVERHCEELYPRLAAAGVTVTVFARSPYVSERLEWRGVEIEPLPAPAGKSSEALVHTVRGVFAARRMRPDVVHCHSIGPGGVLPLSRVLGLRSVLTVHAFDYNQAKWGALASAYLRYGEWAGVRAASEVISVARWMTEDLASRSGRTISYIPNGPYSVERVDTVETVRALGLEPGSYVLFVGRLIPDKRVEDLVAATAGLARQVVIVGDTSHTDDYASALADAAASHAVFAGYRYGRELSELYSHAAAFVLPSSVEGLPLALMEAMSLGVPCVASDIPANREVLGETGWLYPLGDRDGLRKALENVFSLDADARQCVVEAQAGRVRTEYDWDSIAEQTLQVLARAAG